MNPPASLNFCSVVVISYAEVQLSDSRLFVLCAEVFHISRPLFFLILPSGKWELGNLRSDVCLGQWLHCYLLSENLNFFWSIQNVYTDSSNVMGCYTCFRGHDLGYLEFSIYLAKRKDSKWQLRNNKACNSTKVRKAGKHRGPWYFRGELLLKENVEIPYSGFTTKTYSSIIIWSTEHFIVKYAKVWQGILNIEYKILM